MRRLRRSVWCVGLCSLWRVVVACAGGSEGVSNGTARFVQAGAMAHRDGGRVVARVDGREVFARDVASLAARQGLSFVEALDREVERLLLLEEAYRRGYAERADVQRVGRQVAVQRLLHEEVEQRVRGVPEEAVRASFERRKASWARPEERFVAHVTFKPDPQGEASDAGVTSDAGAPRGTAGEEGWERARLRAEALFEEVRSAPDPSEALVRGWDRWRRRLGDQWVRFERMPPVHRSDRLLPEFLDAVFALQRPGLVPRLVRTLYGWHVIVVERIRPARSARYEEAAETLRRELLVQLRKERLASLLRSLRARFVVRLDEDEVWKALSHLGVSMEGGEEDGG